MHVLFEPEMPKEHPKLPGRTNVSCGLCGTLGFVPAENAGARGSAELDTGDSQTPQSPFWVMYGL